MIWIIAVIFGVVVLVIAVLSKSGDAIIGGFTAFIVLSVPFMGFVTAGINVYPNLLGMRATVSSLESEIETMRQAHYSEVTSGSFVGGSLDNVQQSKVLSEYIRSYAKQKAEYNSELEKAKVRRQIMFYRWFAHSAFMSEEVDTLSKL